MKTCAKHKILCTYLEYTQNVLFLFINANKFSDNRIMKTRTLIIGNEPTVVICDHETVWLNNVVSQDHLNTNIKLRLYNNFFIIETINSVTSIKDAFLTINIIP